MHFQLTTCLALPWPSRDCCSRLLMLLAATLASPVSRSTSRSPSFARILALALALALSICLPACPLGNMPANLNFQLAGGDAN